MLAELWELAGMVRGKGNSWIVKTMQFTRPSTTWQGLPSSAGPLYACSGPTLSKLVHLITWPKAKQVVDIPFSLQLLHLVGAWPVNGFFSSFKCFQSSWVISVCRLLFITSITYRTDQTFFIQVHLDLRVSTNFIVPGKNLKTCKALYLILEKMLS